MSLFSSRGRHPELLQETGLPAAGALHGEDAEVTARGSGVIQALNLLSSWQPPMSPMRPLTHQVLHPDPAQCHLQRRPGGACRSGWTLTEAPNPECAQEPWEEVSSGVPRLFCFPKGKIQSNRIGVGTEGTIWVSVSVPLPCAMGVGSPRVRTADTAQHLGPRR